MSKYSGKTITIDRSATEISEKFSDMTRLGEWLDKLPEAEREKIGNIEFTPDSIVIDTQQAGKVALKVTERTPQVVKFAAVGSPVPLDLAVNLNAVGDTSTEVSASIDIQIPMMLRPLVAPHMQKVVDMLTGLIGKLADA